MKLPMSLCSVLSLSDLCEKHLVGGLREQKTET